MVWQKDSTGKTASDAAGYVNDANAEATSKFLQISHDKELEQNCDNQLQQPVIHSHAMHLMHKIIDHHQSTYTFTSLVVSFIKTYYTDSTCFLNDQTTKNSLINSVTRFPSVPDIWLGERESGLQKTAPVTPKAQRVVTLRKKAS